MESDLREELASLAHSMWSGWMVYMFEKGAFTTTWNIQEQRKVQTFHLSYEFVERWTRQMNAEFSALPETEKKSDYDEADRMLAIMQRTTTPQPAQLPGRDTYLSDALKDVPAIKAGPDEPYAQGEKTPKLKQQRPPAQE